MSVPLALLGLLERGPGHGHDLKRDYRLAGDGTFPDVQRVAHPQRTRELTELTRDSDQAGGLLADYAIYLLEADLRWIDHTATRLDQHNRAVR